MNLNTILLKPYTKYWLYLLPLNAINNYKSYTQYYLTFPAKPENCPVCPLSLHYNDVILFFVMDDDQCGFAGYVQLNCDVMINYDKHIFDDDNLNIYYASTKHKYIFDNVMPFKNVIKYLDCDVKGYKNANSFKNMFIKKKYYETCKSYVVQLTDDVQNKKIVHYLNYVHFYPKCKKLSRDDSQSWDMSHESSNGPDDGYIPILIIPCQDYDLMKQNDKIEYFRNHYGKCKKCEVINNNNVELCAILDYAKIEYIETKSLKNDLYDYPITCYWSLTRYIPINKQYDEGPFVRILYIDNVKDVYNGCVLVCWCD